MRKLAWLSKLAYFCALSCGVVITAQTKPPDGGGKTPTSGGSGQSKPKDAIHDVVHTHV